MLYIFGKWAALLIACCFIAVYNSVITDDSRRVSDALAATQLALAKEQRWSRLRGAGGGGGPRAGQSAKHDCGHR